MKKNKSKASAFKKAVEGTPDIAKAHKNGLQALGSYSTKVKLGNTSECSGSVDLDETTKPKYPQDNRWDYIFCYKKEVFFIEVHSANTGEVSTVLRKLQWLKDWLNTKAPEINKLKCKKIGPYFWVQSNGFHIPAGSPQHRQAVQNGIKPVACVNLP